MIAGLLSSDEFLGEDIVAAAFLCSSLHLPWFLSRQNEQMN